MRVSSKGHYGLRVMAELAKAYGEGLVPLAEIARIEHLPMKYLEQVITPLREARLIEGMRGPHGGYQLAREPSQITVGQVIRALEGPIALVECTAESYITGSCVREPVCLSRSVWYRLQQALIRETESISLADMCHDKGFVIPLKVTTTVPC